MLANFNRHCEKVIASNIFLKRRFLMYYAVRGNKNNLRIMGLILKLMDEQISVVILFENY